jgi:hypothetical protein
MGATFSFARAASAVPAAAVSAAAVSAAAAQFGRRRLGRVWLWRLGWWCVSIAAAGYTSATSQLRMRRQGSLDPRMSLEAI